VRTIVGTLEIHEELERKLAAFKGTEAVLVFQSGFTANQAVLGTVLEEGDLVISDALNHASIIDGVRLTKAARAIYQHNDMDDLARVLEESKGKYKKILIVTDGVFSMDGDVAPLDKIANLAEQYGAATMVDDAHGSGVLGDHGRGTVNHFKIAHDRWDITMGTLSKAVGVLGGYVACSRELRELMEHKARPFLFSTSHPPAVTAATIAAIDIMASDEGERLHKLLWVNTNFFKAGLQSLGFDTGISQTPITPVIIGDEAKAMAFSKALFDNGVLATGIVFPTVPRGKARVRTIVTAAHTQDDLQEALDVFAKVGKDTGVI
jgi:glycine C-acetyltransferase